MKAGERSPKNDLLFQPSWHKADLTGELVTYGPNERLEIIKEREVINVGDLDNLLDENDDTAPMQLDNSK